MNSPTDVTIRDAVEADAEAIARVHMESRAATMPYLPPQTRPLDEVTRWVRDIVLPSGEAWVAERAGTVLAYAVLEDDLLDALYVAPHWLGQGIGTRLLATVGEHTDQPLRLFVFEQNTGARRFYERHGFEVTSSSNGADNMEHLPDLTMTWVHRQV